MQFRNIRNGRQLSAVFMIVWSLGAHGQALRDEARHLRDDEKQRQRDEALDKPAPPIAGQAKDSAELDVAPNALAETGTTFQINEIAIDGDTVLGDRIRQQVVAPFLGLELGQRRIDLLLRRLTAAYLDRGYPTTRAYLAPQNLASGRLVISVVPGTVERIEVDGAPVKGLASSAFPSGTGEALRLSDLEQAVDQINRLRSRQAEARILPGQAPGASTIAIDSHAERPWRVGLGADNYGQRATGDQRQRLTVEVDNLLGAWEALSLQQLYSPHSQTTLFSLSAPLGYGTVSYSWADSQSSVMVTDTIKSQTQAQSHTLGWNYVLTRDQISRWSIDGTFSHRTAQRRLDTISLLPQYNATGRLALSGLLRGQKGALTLEVGYSQGLRAFGADGDVDGLPKTAPHNEFEKWDFAISGAWTLSPSLAWRTSIVGQTSRTGLPGHEQLFLGGNGTIRGFREGIIGADKGVYVRNELQFTRLLDQATNEAGWQFQPLAFLDASSSRLLADTTYRRLTSAGLGVRASWKDISADVAWGKPLDASSGVDKSGWVHAAINIQF